MTYRCPNCEAELLPVAYCEDVWGCRTCRETWHIVAGEKPHPWPFKNLNREVSTGVL